MNWKTHFALIGIILLVILGGLLQEKKINSLALSSKIQEHQEVPLKMSLLNQTSLEEQLVDANTRFGLKLFSAIVQEDRGKNIFVSPVSVAIALSMTYNGSSSTTEQEMADALQIQGMSLTAINEANQTLLNKLEQADSKVKLSIANSLWAREGFDFKPQFLENNRQFYQAQVTNLDFTNPNAANIINSWVKNKTNNKIDQIIKKINPDDVLFLINAIYFKGNWTKEFNKDRTTEKPFYLSDGQVKQHPMMSQNGKYRYYENDEFQALSLPYGEGNLSMYIFLPSQESNLDEFLEKLTPENFNNWMTQFRKRDGFIELPRFKLEYEIELKKALQALGMESMFDRTKADFSAMTNNPVRIDTVKHKTFVEVNEEGTEAAAVTSIGIRTTSTIVRSQPFTMVVDRPFFCLIRDNQTKTILFMGSIVEPN